MTAFGNFVEHDALGMRLLRVPVSSVYEEAEPFLVAAPSFADLMRVYDIHIYTLDSLFNDKNFRCKITQTLLGIIFIQNVINTN